MTTERIEEFYQSRGKEIVDVLFDKGYFREDVSRSSMQDVEDFIAFYIQSQCKMAVTLAELSKRVKKSYRGNMGDQSDDNKAQNS